MSDANAPPGEAGNAETAGATLVLSRMEVAALIAACHTLLGDLITSDIIAPDGSDLIAPDGSDLFPDAARPLFRVYCKLCFVSTHKADLRFLRAASRTWGG